MRLCQGLSVIILFIIKKMRESDGSLFLIISKRERLDNFYMNGIFKNIKTLSKGVTMERNTQANNGKELRYSFRNYKLRLVSVTIGAVF